MSKIKELLDKYRSITDHFGDQQWYDEDVEKAMREYAEYYGKLSIRNTRYKATDIVQKNIYQSKIPSSGKTVDVDRVIRDIQNIDNKEILPEHD